LYSFQIIPAHSPHEKALSNEFIKADILTYKEGYAKFCIANRTELHPALQMVVPA